MLRTRLKAGPRALWSFGLVLTLQGCASLFGSSDAVVDRALTDELRQQVDHTVSFAQVLAAPDSYAGRVIMVSGVALKAKRAKDRTEIEVLQLPREEGRPPVRDRTLSEGRFLAIHPAFLDPAKIEGGLPMTVIGEVKGAEMRPLDEGEYKFPVLEIKQLVTWAEPTDADSRVYAMSPLRPYNSAYHWWGPNAYYFGPFGPYPSAPYTNPAACPFCFYPPGGPYSTVPPR